jgi:DNA-binding transcriptional ArsR family regulator
MTRRGLRRRLAKARVLTAASAERDLAAPVLAALTERGPCTADAIAAALRIPWTKATVVLSALLVVGLVRVERVGTNGPVVYSLPPGVRVLVAVTGVPQP